MNTNLSLGSAAASAALVGALADRKF